MAVDLNNMATQIKTILAGVSGIAATFEYEPQNMPQLPAATLYFDGFTGQEETMGRIQYDWKWSIRLYVPLNTSDIKTPQLTTRTLVMGVLQALRANIQLNGSALLSSVNAGDISTILDVNNPLMITEFTLIATTQENR